MADVSAAQTLAQALKEAESRALAKGFTTEDAYREALARHLLSRGLLTWTAEHDSVVSTHKTHAEVLRSQHAKDLESLKASEGRNGEKLRALIEYLRDLAPAGGTRKTVPAEAVRKGWQAFDRTP